MKESTAVTSMPPASRSAPENAQPEHSWDAYWEELREEPEIFAAEAAEYVRRLTQAIPIDSSTRLLDFGCGFGFVGNLLSLQAGAVFLWDASPTMRRRAQRNTKGRDNVRFVDLSDAHGVPPDVRFDLILVNSVVQYMSVDELNGWLVRWRNLLAPTGRLVVSDLIPPDHATSSDLTGLLKLSARSGLITKFLLGRLREFRRYWRMRQSAPLARMSQDELRARAAAAGLVVDFLPANLTHLTGRMAAVLSRAAGSTPSQSPAVGRVGP